MATFVCTYEKQMAQTQLVPLRHPSSQVFYSITEVRSCHSGAVQELDKQRSRVFAIDAGRVKIIEDLAVTGLVARIENICSQRQTTGNGIVHLDGLVEVRSHVNLSFGNCASVCERYDSHPRHGL